MQLAKMEAAHLAERNGLKEKLERLQRANKQRRAEIENMQGKLSSMHQHGRLRERLRLRPGASVYDQVPLIL